MRGVRLYADGIPATMPDGQGQTSNFDLASAARIDVLRGPFSALYGNSSGGVISVFTENGKPGLAISPFAQFGSYDTMRYGIKASGQQQNINHVTSVSRFDTDGYRTHSAARRDIANAKLRITTDADSAFTLVGNAVSMRDVQDPLGLSRAQYESDPRSAHPNALLFNTRKSVRQEQAGLTWEKILNKRDTLNLMFYGGRRDTVQYLAVPPVAQRAPTSAGGVIDLEREYGGVDVRLSREQSESLQWTVGASYDTLGEDRLGYENSSEAMLGVQGRLRRNEHNNAHNFDQYAQAQWKPGPRWLLLAGIRNSNVRVRSHDFYIAPGNGDDSGALRYHATTPVLGATYRATDNVNLYASYGKGFETPTLNELSYRPGSPAAAGFNVDLQPSKSDHIEIGVKSRIGEHARLNFAAFHVNTKNELTVASNSGGRAVYRNAGETRRNGFELALEGKWPNGLGMLLSWSLLDTKYATSFCSGSCTPATIVAAGNRIPGVPRQTGFGELSWRAPASGLSIALEAQYVGKVFVDDINSDAADPYVLGNLRIGFEQKAGPWHMEEFLRVDNITNRRHAGSVIVNESNGRYFEPGPMRNYLVGISFRHSW